MKKAVLFGLICAAAFVFVSCSSGGDTVVVNSKPWVDVAGTAIQAEPNVGYLANNPTSQVAITLPSSLAVGDTVAVSGIGAGGWKLTQNAGQSVITTGMAQWSELMLPGASMIMMTDIVASGDGAKLAISAADGKVYRSTDSGHNWLVSSTSITSGTISLASSSDGTKLTAVVRAGAADAGGRIYTSADSGDTWVSSAPTTTANWAAVASSSDGIKLVAVAGSFGGPNDEKIFTSTDSGGTWLASAPSTTANWWAVVSSSDGTKLAASGISAANSRLYTSADSGLSWTLRRESAAMFWQYLASSADGNSLIAGGAWGFMISTDSGQTWTEYSSGFNMITGVALSADGARMIVSAADAGSGVGYIYTSTDSGVTWDITDSLVLGNAYLSAASADCRRLFALPFGGSSILGFIGSTTEGISGSIQGDQYESIEVQYVGNGRFDVLNHEGEPEIR